MAAAAMTPSGEPPMPTYKSTPESGMEGAMAAVMSPSLIIRKAAPVERTDFISALWRSRASMTTVRSRTRLFSALATMFRFASTGCSS